ncbi:MAG: DUF3187 family protein [Steroidobacteraceae bacterium]
MRRKQLVGLVILAAVLPAGVRAEPLVTMNQNPLVLPYGLPLPLPARLSSAGHGRYGVVANWSNTATIEDSGTWNATVDAETVDLRLRVEYALDDRWALMAEIPWRSIGGGSLDGAIEGWHDFWGMPNGDRDQLPSDGYLIEVNRDGQPLLNLDDTGSGVADIPIRGGYQLHADEKTAVSAWLTVDLPTGDPDYLLGNGATDVAVSLAAQSQVAEHWQVFGQFDVAWLGAGDVLRGFQQDWVVAGLAGVTWNAWRALDLTVQVDANSKVFDVPVNGVSGDAVVLGFGGTWRTTGGWRFDLGMEEDVDVGASPDATFYLLAQKSF